MIVRIAFAISVFFGGLGALAYIALALFVPVGEEGEEVGEAPIESSRGLAIGAGVGLAIIALSWGIFDGAFFGDGWLDLRARAAARGCDRDLRQSARGRRGGARRGGAGRTALGVAAGIVIAVFAIGALGALAVASAWAAATGHGVAIAAAVIAIGALLALSAFRGSGARWLIIPAVAVAAPLAVVSAADISFGDGVGEREYRPATAAALPADGYELGIGRLVVDLRGLDWSDDTVVDLDIDLGIGQAVVAVPENVCVSADARRNRRPPRRRRLGGGRPRPRGRTGRAHRQPAAPGPHGRGRSGRVPRRSTTTTSTSTTSATAGAATRTSSTATASSRQEWTRHAPPGS